jgi:potassium large conductance calcium-activated channel subfamily M alpha protein 1
MRKVGIAGSTISQQILLLVVSTFGVVFLIAGLLQWVEYNGAPQDQRDSQDSQCNGPCINFWDAFYFVIVTVCVPLVLASVCTSTEFSSLRPRFS